MLTSMIRRIPLVGSLVDSKRDSFLSATKEITLSTVFSTLPIWFFPGCYTIFFNDSPSFFENVFDSISQGDLYIYSSALIGPLLFALTSNYMEWNDKESNPHASRIGKLSFTLPYGTLFLIISILISMLAVFCFGFTRFEISGAIIAKLNKTALLNVSIFLYIVSLLCLFIATVYKNDILNTTPSDLDDSQEFYERWRSR